MTDTATLAREFGEAWNRRDWDHWRAVLHPEAYYVSPDGQRHEGPEAALAGGQMWAEALPDAHVEIQGVYASGDTVTMEQFARGTHTGELMGIPPTNRQAAFPVCHVLEVRDGKISAWRFYGDLLTLLTQLGVVQLPEEARL